MSTFILAISCLTTSNLPWFMDLIFQVPMQYCSLQHQTLLLPSVTSTTGYWFCFGSIPSFFLELFLYWSPVAYWTPTDLGSSPFTVLSFCLFILFMGLSRQEYWSGLPFPSPVDHILSVDLFQQHKKRLYTYTSPAGQHQNQIDYILCSKEGEALYSQQKQDRELTVAQIMNSLLPNSDLNWRKWGKPLDHSGMT